MQRHSLSKVLRPWKPGNLQACKQPRIALVYIVQPLVCRLVCTYACVSGEMTGTLQVGSKPGVPSNNLLLVELC